MRLWVVLGALLALAATGNAVAAGNVVISQVYGGGGNSGATLENDFIELYNRSLEAQDGKSMTATEAATPIRLAASL